MRKAGHIIKKSILIKDIDQIHTFNAGREVIEGGFILIEENRITRIGRRGEWIPEADEVVDMRGRIVLPGLVNVHHHFYQNLTRAIPVAQKGSILEWLKYLYCLWAFLEPEDIRIATRVAAGELLLSGCTTSSDFFYLFPRGQKELFDGEIEAASELGIRLHAVRGSLPVLEGRLNHELKEMNIDPGLLVEDKREILEESERVIRRYHDGSPLSMIRIGLGPTTVDYHDEDFARALKELANEHSVLFHFHLHPRPDERETCRKLHGKSPSEYLEAIGWLDERTCVAHATNHTPDDIDILAGNGVSVSHSPSCHMRLGYRVAPIPEMKRKGILVGLGVDGGASNDSGNMLSELRATMMVHRINGVHPGLSSKDWFSPYGVFEMATLDGARLLHRDEDLGSIEEGKAADLVAWDLNRLGYAGGSTDPLSALLFCGLDYRVDFSMVNGRMLVRGGKLLCLNEQELVEQANQVTRRLVSKAESATGVKFSQPV